MSNDPIIQSIQSELERELEAITGVKALRIPVTPEQLKKLETISKSLGITPVAVVLGLIDQLSDDFGAKKSCPLSEQETTRESQTN